jgi:hypothetical protein
MNKIIRVSIILAAAAMTACGSHEPTIASKPVPISDSKISFGVYDIAPSGPGAFLADIFAAPKLSDSSISTSGGELTTLTQLASPAPNGGSGQHQTPAEMRPAPMERKIIRNAELGLESDQPEESQKRIAAIAQSKGGFVVASQQSSSDPQVDARDIVDMSVRIPADKFTETVEEIRTTSRRVIVETVKGEDVTEEFIDTEARLKAKTALEQQFMEIMKRANTVEEALSVQSQLANVRAEIEKIEGRRRFLENQATLSTIKIRLQMPAIFASNSAGFFDRLAESFGRGIDIALNFILGLITFVIGVLPFALFVGVPGYLICRSVLHRRNRPMSVSEIAEEEIKNE